MMDPLPKIVKKDPITNDVLHELNEHFIDELNEQFHENIADNLRLYIPDDDFSLVTTANDVFKIYKYHRAKSTNIKSKETEIIKQHGEYLIFKNVINANIFLRELLKLKPCDIFKFENLYEKAAYGLLEKCDLYPDIMAQYLDFRYNETLHRCETCYSLEKAVNNAVEVKKVVQARSQKKTDPEIPSPFSVDPSEFIFKNYETNTLYKRTLKITNISKNLHKISVRRFPKSCEFCLVFESCQLAPGMYTTASIKFKTRNYDVFEDSVSLINRKGFILTIPIHAYRDPPLLVGIVFNATTKELLFEHGNVFSRSRQEVLNDTIDCGSVYTTGYNFILVGFYNGGHKARFFLMTEDDFHYMDIKDISTDLEMQTKDSFWIYPTFFEIDSKEILDVMILFQPMQCGFQHQSLYLMCDNHAYRKIDIIGDGVCFDKNMITVEVAGQTKGIEKKDGHCIYLGYVRFQEGEPQFTLTISNYSPVNQSYAFKLDTKDSEKDMSSWVRMVSPCFSFLPPYTMIDVTFDVVCPRDVPNGYYNCSLRLYILNVPIAALESDTEFIISTRNIDLEKVIDNLYSVDVLVMDVEVACYVDTYDEEVLQDTFLDYSICKECNNVNCTCTVCQEPLLEAILQFDKTFIDFGLIQVGINFQREIELRNKSLDAVTWYIVELIYNIDSQPYVDIMENNHLTISFGHLKSAQSVKTIYKVENKPLGRYVSMLVVLSGSRESSIAEDITVITYEIVKLDIMIKSAQSNEPVLCPMQMLYIDIPVSIKFKIINLSRIPGCFYLFDPVGEEADNININYEPKKGKLKPRSSKKINITLTCGEIGILENIYIPCFIGTGQKLIMIQLLCVVDCLHVFFYLPTDNGDFEKMLWPPKVVFDYEIKCKDYCFCEEQSFVERIMSQHQIELDNKSRGTLASLKSKSNIDEEKQKDQENIIEMLEELDSELFLRDCVMVVRGVTVGKPKKVTIYVENITPKAAQFTVQSCNFPAEENKIGECFGPQYKKTDLIWRSMLGQHGILVEPQIPSTRNLEPHSILSIDIWIFAITWGVYTEEIIVDMENIIPFSFSCIVEVIGSPLELPMSMGHITENPTIRFGSVIFHSEPITKQVVVQNYSSIEATASWHSFFSDEDKTASDKFNLICDVDKDFELSLTDRYLGVDGLECIEVGEVRMCVAPGGTFVLPLTLKPDYFRKYCDRLDVKCFVLGRIFAGECDRFKSNYFYRKPTSLLIEVTAAIEIPLLEIRPEMTNFNIYANDIAINRKRKYFMRIMVRNPTLSIVTASIECNDPFKVNLEDVKFTLDPGKTRKITVICDVSFEKILRWSTHVYKLSKTEESTGVSQLKSDIQVPNRLRFNHELDEEQKVLSFSKKLYFIYTEEFCDFVPLRLSIFYPKIMVKPNHVKFDFVLIGSTVKTMITIYNLTGCKVIFEMMKSVSSQEIVVSPSHGEIEATTGVNPSFKNVFIYFTPIEHKIYQESVRVTTNFPRYHFDITIRGSGSINEKFDKS